MKNKTYLAKSGILVELVKSYDCSRFATCKDCPFRRIGKNCISLASEHEIKEWLEEEHDEPGANNEYSEP